MQSFNIQQSLGTKPPLPCSPRDKIVISPNLWHGRVPRNIPSPLKLPFPLISTAKDLIVCYCHDKRLHFSRVPVRPFSLYLSLFFCSLVLLSQNGRLFVFLRNCDIRPEWTKMQIQQIRVFSSEPSELAI